MKWDAPMENQGCEFEQEPELVELRVFLQNSNLNSKHKNVWTRIQTKKTIALESNNWVTLKE